MDFGYFHEEESEQFAFYRIPQVLFKDEKFAKLSTDAKVLYGLFLNRVSLSKKNHWIDEEGRVYTEVHKRFKEMSEDLLRRARFLVICGNKQNEEVKDDIAIARKSKVIVTTLDGVIGL